MSQRASSTIALLYFPIVRGSSFSLLHCTLSHKDLISLIVVAISSFKQRIESLNLSLDYSGIDGVTFVREYEKKALLRLLKSLVFYAEEALYTCTSWVLQALLSV